VWGCELESVMSEAVVAGLAELEPGELVLTFFEIELRKSTVAGVGSLALELAMPDVAAAGLV
jgi:hypothetical protein